jgi:hypothetical protein
METILGQVHPRRPNSSEFDQTEPVQVPGRSTGRVELADLLKAGRGTKCTSLRIERSA